MIILILFLGLLLRLINLNQSLWWDEGITFTAASKYNLQDLITKFPLGDFHPPFYYILLMFWTKIFGTSEIALRAPSVALGVILILLVYLIGKKIFNAKIGLTASIFIATSPLLIYYSQEARMYMLDAVLVAMSMYLFIFLIESNFKSLLMKVGFIAVNVLILYSDYIIYLIFPVQLVFLILFKRLVLIRYLSLLIITGVFLLPWIPILMVQMDNGNRVREALPVWATVVGGVNFKEIGLLFAKTIFGRISFDNKMIYATIALIGSALYGFLIMLNLKSRNTYSNILLIWLILPVILALLISLYTPVFSYFRMIFILPALYLLTSRGIYLLPNKLHLPTIAIIITASLGFIFIFNTTPRFQREDWRGAVKYAQDFDEGKAVIVFETSIVPDVFNYYDLTKGKTSPVAGADTVIHFEYLVDIVDKDRLFEKELASIGFKKVGTKDFNGVGFVNILQR